ncbi:MAG TPA: hypothetical protein PKY30_02705 [Myxococcota bacterium]|nr:hypothetical protein [Myxococcota bacterium]HNH45917.1 hypothetical protein [Myxococcota bacterium]
MDWRSELQTRLSRDAEGELRFGARTATEILAEKDEGRMIVVADGARRWEGTEHMGRREGRWLFLESGKIRFEVIYVADKPAWLCGYLPDGAVDPAAVFEGRWRDERSDFAQSRALLVALLAGLRSPADVPVVVRDLAGLGGSRAQILRAFREGLGLPLAVARQIIDEHFAAG